MAREISRQTFLRGAAGALAAGTVFGPVRATADPNTSGWEGLSTAIGGQVILPDNGVNSERPSRFSTPTTTALRQRRSSPRHRRRTCKRRWHSRPRTTSRSLRAVVGTPMWGPPRRTAPWCSTCVSCPGNQLTTPPPGSVTVTPATSLYATAPGAGCGRPGHPDGHLSDGRCRGARPGRRAGRPIPARGPAL